MGFGRDYAYQREQMQALEDAQQMQALAVAGNYRDDRFHNLMRPEPLGIGDTIHAATALQHGPLAIGYGSDDSHGSGRRSADRYTISTPSGSEADSEGRSADEQPSSLQQALQSLRLTREPTFMAQAGNIFRGMAAPIVLPTAAAHTAFEALMRQFQGASSEGLSIQYAPRRRLRGKQRAPLAIEGPAGAPLALEDRPPRRRLRGKQPRPENFG
jgi:hypothetical protein